MFTGSFRRITTPVTRPTTSASSGVRQASGKQCESGCGSITGVCASSAQGPPRDRLTQVVRGLAAREDPDAFFPRLGGRRTDCRYSMITILLRIRNRESHCFTSSVPQRFFGPGEWRRFSAYFRRVGLVFSSRGYRIHWFNPSRLREGCGARSNPSRVAVRPNRLYGLIPEPVGVFSTFLA